MVALSSTILIEIKDLNVFNLNCIQKIIKMSNYTLKSSMTQLLSNKFSDLLDIFITTRQCKESDELTRWQRRRGSFLDQVSKKPTTAAGTQISCHRRRPWFCFLMGWRRRRWWLLEQSGRRRPPLPPPWAFPASQLHAKQLQFVHKHTKTINVVDWLSHN